LRNVDFTKGRLTVPTSKLGAQRTLQLKPQMRGLLQAYVSRRKIEGLDERLFASAGKVKDTWRKYRKRAFEKFIILDLLKIRLYDLRHWFATTTYLKTRDIFLVKYLLGHRRIENTMVYMHLAQGLDAATEEFTSRTARTVEEACKLVEAGFTYVTEFDGIKIFRKRK
jgi:integrase